MTGLKKVLILLCFSVTGCAGPMIKATTPTPGTDTLANLRQVDGRVEIYRLHIGDQLAVKFFNSPDLNEEVTIRPDGMISLQLIGGIEAAGSSPEELANAIESEYKKILKNPSVTVVVRQFAGQRVFLGGDVRNPGVVRLDAPTTVLQAVFQAGGCLDSASVRDIILIRRADESRASVYKLDLEDPANDVFLLPFDIVYVPKSAIASADLFVEQYIERLIPISRSIGLTYGDYVTH